MYIYFCTLLLVLKNKFSKLLSWIMARYDRFVILEDNVIFMYASIKRCFRVLLIFLTLTFPFNVDVGLLRKR